MTKTDTSREAVERYLDAREKHLGTTSDQERIHSVGLPNCGIATLTTTDILALLTERDALQARAERAEAGLRKVRAQMRLIEDEVKPHIVTDLVGRNNILYGIAQINATLAQLDAEPAGFATTGAEELWCEDVENACPHCGGSGHKGDVSEPAGVKVDREAVARALWKVNCCDSTYDEAVKASEKGIGADASAVLFIHELADAAIAALEPGQTHREVWEQAKEAAAIVARNACLAPPDGGSPTEEEVALCDEAERRIRAMKYPGDSQ